MEFPKNKSASFSFSGIASPGGTAVGSSGFNNITVYFQDNQTYGTGNFYTDQTQTNSYAIEAGDLTITSVTPMSGTIASGETFTRAITIENTGNGRLYSLVVRDFHGTSLDVESVDIGTLNYYGNKITLNGADFSTVGDGDNQLDPGESITITETIRAFGCSDTQSEIYARFGCYGSWFYSNAVYPYTSFTQEAPNLTVTPTATFNTCVNDGPDVQSVVIENTGAGTATDILLDIFQHRGEGFDDIFSRIDIYNIQAKRNDGSFSHVAPWGAVHTDCEGPYACLGYNAIGRVILGLPDLESGDTYTIKWNSYTCDTDYCDQVDLIGWKYDLWYEDGCNSNEFVTSGVGQEHKGKNVSTIVEYPTDIDDGDNGLFSYTLSSAKVDLPTTEDTYLEAVFEVPDELIVTGASNQLTFSKDGTNWSPSELTFNNGELIAKYDWPAPFELSGATISLELALDCQATTPAIVDGTADLDFQLTYIMDGSCSETYELPLVCENLTTNLHCENICAKGILFDDFSIQRTTLGYPDNDQNRQADASGDLDMHQIKLRRVLPGDEFETTFTGTVKTTFSTASFAFAYANTQLNYGEYIEPIGATLTVIDASTGSPLSTDLVTYTHFLNDDTRTVLFDFSVATLVANGASQFTGFTYADDDLVILKPKYRVVGNIGATTAAVEMSNELTMALSASGTQYGCGTQSDLLTLIGYTYTVQSEDNNLINHCEPQISKYLQLNVGDCCDDDFVEYFPYEYRSIAQTHNLDVQIPEGFLITSGYVRQTRLQGDNDEITENHPIAANNPNGQWYTINLGTTYTTNGGSIYPADESFKAEIFLTLETDCGTTSNSDSVTWNLALQEKDGTIATLPANTDNWTLDLADLALSTTAQTIAGIEKKVSWEFKLTNTSESAPAEFSWLALQNEAGNLEIEKVIDLETQTELFADGVFYKLGALPEGSEKKIQVIAKYHTCEIEQLDIFSGHSCEGYPSSLNTLVCNYQELDVYVDPQTADLQVTLESNTQNDNATTFNTIELTVANEGQAFLDNFEITIETPGISRLQMVEGKTEVEYPIGSPTEVNTSTPVNNVYTFTDENLTGEIYKNGLAGTTKPDENVFQLRFNVAFMPEYESGDQLLIRVKAKSVCGADQSVYEFRYDPNQLYAQLTDIGIADGTNNWGVSWADYDQDGDPDLFITNYDTDQPNTLYNNQGDGTFALHTEGPIATDMANSVGSSWGDYDNDGDLDLYVTNTIGFPNFLYRNEGSGDFIRVQDDPVVSYTAYSHGVSWVDYDNDGFLDLFIADFFSTKFNLLYHNNGDGTFTEITTSPVVLDAGSSVSGVWADYDDDRDMDLFVANTNGENNWLYRNDGNGNFTKITEGVVVNDGGKSVGGSWGDIDNDGDLDLFVANAGGENNFLYFNNGDGTFTKNTTDVAATQGGNSHGSTLGDLDNDGDLDLVVTNDAGEHNFYYVNDGNGNFNIADNQFSSDAGESFGVAWADFDNDGDLDLYVVNHGDNDNFFYRNDRDISKDLLTYSQACISLQGILSNSFGMGARIEILATIFGAPVWQTREITGQTGGGLSSQNDATQIFGLGDATSIDSVIIYWPSGLVQNFGYQDVSDCLTFVEDGAAQICGTAYYDANNNCSYDVGETLLPNAPITIQPGNTTVYTDENGEYTLSLTPGTYTLNQSSLENWAPSCGTAGLVVNAANPNETYCDNNFANGPASTELLPDLEVALASTAMRIGFESLYAITYGNTGTAAADNTVLAVDFGTDVIPLDATVAWDSVAGTTYFWNLGTLGLGIQSTIYVYDSISTDAIIDNLATVSASIRSDQNDLDAGDNTVSDSNILVGAFDPNDILVFPEGVITKDEVLTYKIRFQNVGNAEVNTVRIVNELPEELDMRSLELGTTSHSFQFSLEGERTLIWNFENIFLPDSTTNEPESHGFVTFRIQPKESLEPGEEILNQAAIFFDNNDPILTNIVSNTIFAAGNEKPGTLTIYPNPLTSGEATVAINPKSLVNGNVAIDRVQIIDALGRTVYNIKGWNANIYPIQWEVLQAGYYIVQVIGADGNEYIGKLIVR